MGGRVKGTPNKQPVEFRATLRKYCDDHDANPHLWMARLLADPQAEVAHKLQAARELAQYIEPKLKAVELTGDVEKPLHVVMGQVTKQERTLRQARIADLDAKRAHAYGTDDA